MTSPTPVDPYTVLGVSKEASAADIRSAYKKLILKCHPDKIKDEAQRIQGQDEFQKVQEAYELLSDDAKRARHDQKARLAELKKEAFERDGAFTSSSHRPSKSGSPYDYRGGRVYEERVPGGARFFDEDIQFTEEIRPSSRKYDGYEKRQSTRDGEERKKSSKYYDVKRESTKPTKERGRDSRSSRSDRAKNRDKERRREFTDKYNRSASIVSENDMDSDDIFVQPEFLDSKSKPSSRPKKSKSSESRRHRDADLLDAWESSKVDYLEETAREYMQRRGGNVPIVSERRPSYPTSPVYYDAKETLHGDSARRSSAKPRATRESSRPRSSGRDRRSPTELLEPTLKSYARTPPLPSATSAPSGIKVPMVSKLSPPTPRRAATASHIREKRDPPTIHRSETLPIGGIGSRRTEPIVPRSSKLKDLYDSGYSSPGTPEMHQGSPPKSSRYTIVDESEDYFRGHRTVLIDPSASASYRHHHSTSSGRQEVSTPVTVRGSSKSSRSRTHESSRTIPTVPTMRNSPSLRSGPGRDTLFAEVTPNDYPQRFPEDQVRYSPRIRQEDVAIGHSSQSRRDAYPHTHRSDSQHRPGMSRKESCAY